jgi:DNA-binding CsgD family transcriptional regulator
MTFTASCVAVAAVRAGGGPDDGDSQASLQLVGDRRAGLSGAQPALQECLQSMLTIFERSVGFAEGVVMSFDPDVLLPNAFATTAERSLGESLVACRNEQLDPDLLKFRDLAAGPSRVGVASRDSDPRTRSSPRWLEILDVRGHGHELRAALVDASGQCWGALNLMRESGRPFAERDIRRVEGRIERCAAAVARSMVAGATPAGTGPEPGSVWMDEAGAIVFASPAAQRWLDLLDAGSRDGFARALLAGLAMRVVGGRGQHRTGGPAGDGEAARAVAVRVRTADGRWVRARAETIASPDESARGVVVSVDAARAGCILPLAAGAYRLTGRELEVVRGVLNGLDTRSVAASLHITEYTVQDHLKSVFGKTGVRSRRELAHHLAIQFG